MNARSGISLPAEAPPVWLLPVVAGLGALALVAVLGLRSTQRIIDREAQWQVPADPDRAADTQPGLSLTEAATSAASVRNS